MGLPKFAEPIRYDVRLSLDFTSGTFAGTVSIDLLIRADTSFFVLNAADLYVDRASAVFTHRTSSKPLGTPTVTLFKENDILLVKYGETLPHGEGVLRLSFNGRLDVTFELTGGAKRFFPCWDEPYFKACFKITIDAPIHSLVLSDMIISEGNITGSIKTISFEETATISTLDLKLAVRNVERDAFEEMDMDIVAGDVVMNKITKAIGLVRSLAGQLLFVPIAHSVSNELQRKEVVVVSRNFEPGVHVCSRAERSKVGRILDIDKKVDLASPKTGDITHKGIGATELKRMRTLFVGDFVVSQYWMGSVEDLELSVKVKFADGVVLTELDPDPNECVPLFTNEVEEEVDEPYYKGQEFVWHNHEGKAIQGFVISHKVKLVTVKWLDTCVTGAEKPPTVLTPKMVTLFRSAGIRKADWELGHRCIFGGDEYVVANFQTTVKVQWKDGIIEEISGSELVDLKQQPPMLEPFDITHIVVAKEDTPHAPAFGTVMGVSDDGIRVEWEDGSVTIVDPLDVRLLNDDDAPSGDDDDPGEDDDPGDDDDDPGGDDDDPAYDNNENVREIYPVSDDDPGDRQESRTHLEENYQDLVCRAGT